MRRPLIVLALFMIFIAVAAATCRQKTSDMTDIASDAALIFRGEVIAVELRAPSAPDEIAETRVTFRVEDGVRGVANGQMLTIRQWSAAPDEYRVGESLILFLHAPSSQLGFTSPVGGRAGHKRLDEVPPEVLDSLRTVVAPRVAPASPAVPKLRPPRKLPRGRNAISREAAQ
jgi:hypothetical protein